MNRMMALTIVSISLGALSWAQDSNALIDEAAKLYESRHLDPANLDKSYDILKGVVGTDSLNVRALSELSHIHYLLGDRAQTKKDKLDFYQKGADWGKRAIKVDEKYAEAHLWYMVNLGRIGQTKGVLNSLGMVPDLKREVNRALELDPKLTPALDARAMIYYELPGLFGGDLNKSQAALDQALAIDSNYSILYVDLAKVMIKKKDFEKARWLLNRCVSIADPTYPADFTLDDKPDAERLIKDIEGK